MATSTSAASTSAASTSVSASGSASASTSTTSTSGNTGIASPSTSVICEEIFDETEPSAEEINDYAMMVSIDPVKEPHLLYLAKEGLMQALPSDWKICYSEEKCGHYYYNIKTKQSQWDHPLDAVYRELVEQARQKNTTTIAATPIIDNSDDASQLDSGIRSLQGNDECDNTNNTNEISSPVSNINTNSTARCVSSGVIAGTIGVGANASSVVGVGLLSNSGSTSNSTSTSGFSGGVSRFLESRSKNFGLNFQPVKGSRFEVTKTNPQISLAMKFGESFSSKLAAANKVESDAGAAGGSDKRAFVLSGTGSMFLKSRKQMEVGLNQATAAMLMNTSSSNIIAEGMAGTPPGVKGILRDSSLTDMRRRLDRDDAENGGLGGEDKKSVRFNLEDTKIRGSPEEEPSSSRKLTQSPEASVYSDDDEAVDDDPWDDDNDDDEELDGCVGYGALGAEGSVSRSLNPFLANDDKLIKDIQVISVPKAQTIQMLKAQSFSMDLPERDRAKFTELARSQSTESGSSIPQPASVVSYLEKLKDSSTTVKPMYEDTDSESKGSSVRSFIINKSEQDSVNSIIPAANPFETEESAPKSNRDHEISEAKPGFEKPSLRTLKVASKLVGFLKKDTEKSDRVAYSGAQQERESDKDYEMLRQKVEKEKEAALKEERERLEEKLQSEIDAIKIEHGYKLKSIGQEYDSRLASHRHELEQTFQTRLNEYRTHLEEELNMKRKTVVDEHKAHMATLQKNHAEILHDLERDLKSEEEIIKKEHARKHAEMRDKLAHELDLERQRMRETGEDRLYEKVRCEKRLLEDKYRCLKEKYVRLKTDVKLSLERRNRRREAQALHQQSLHTNTTTTGSETERSISNKPSIGNSENRSLSLSTSCQDHGVVASIGVVPHSLFGGKHAKPPVPPKTHLTPVISSKEHGNIMRERSNERAQPPTTRKPGIASKYIKHLQVQDDTTTSISQSDTTISNNYSKGRYLPAPILSDNGNSDSEAAFQCNQENNNNGRSNGQRKKVFSRLKSASTSRLNSDNYKNDRPCTPVENLRHQLQKLEDLEDQFPDNTLDTTYHLRYPFSDISNDRAGAGNSSELEFFKHRIHLERDSVRRAKESLRTQRTNFRARQREIKQRHKASTTRHSLDQLIQEEKELTEMEVNLHRTRALLGEKVIRLRHLEQSLSRIYEKEKPTMDLLGVEQKDDATLSDLSSHSSSGFSSTDFASGADTHNLHKRKENYHQESTECIQNLEILNAEIREILDILGKGQQHGGIPMISPSDLNWSHMLSAGVSAANTPHVNPQNAGTPTALMHAPQSIPTLADRLETYRQLATGRMQNSMGGAILAANTIVSQSPRAVNYTTSLVERTRDLRNWLRQAKTEHELLTSGGNMGLPLQHTGMGLTANAMSVNTVSAGVSGGAGVGVVAGATATSGGGGGAGTQTNL